EDRGGGAPAGAGRAGLAGAARPGRARPHDPGVRAARGHGGEPLRHDGDRRGGGDPRDVRRHLRAARPAPARVARDGGAGVRRTGDPRRRRDRALRGARGRRRDRGQLRRGRGRRRDARRGRAADARLGEQADGRGVLRCGRPGPVGCRPGRCLPGRGGCGRGRVAGVVRSGTRRRCGAPGRSAHRLTRRLPAGDRRGRRARPARRRGRPAGRPAGV
ncbi:MAG: carbon monoxide dehydrogenase G protein, partial [uncultured Nocardioidaceae bacterium]